MDIDEADQTGDELDDISTEKGVGDPELNGLVKYDDQKTNYTI